MIPRFPWWYQAAGGVWMPWTCTGSRARLYPNGASPAGARTVSRGGRGGAPECRPRPPALGGAPPACRRSGQEGEYWGVDRVSVERYVEVGASRLSDIAQIIPQSIALLGSAFAGTDWLLAARGRELLRADLEILKLHRELFPTKTRSCLRKQSARGSTRPTSTTQCSMWCGRWCC